MYEFFFFIAGITCTTIYLSLKNKKYNGKNIERFLFKQKADWLALRKIPFFVMIINIDNFKNVVSIIGYNEYTKITKNIKFRLQCANTCFCYIFRNKEFVVIFTDIDSSKMDIITVDILNYFKEPFVSSEYSITLSCSIGWSSFPQHAGNSSTLLKNANTALQYAKKTGNAATKYNYSMNQKLERHILLMKNMREGLVLDQFEPYFQPRVKVNSDGSTTVLSAEALARWRKGNGEIILPGEFITIAESSGMINELGKIMIFKACTEQCKWAAVLGNNAPSVSVNVSPKQFSDNFPEVVQRIMLITGIEPSKLQIEITESETLSHIEKSLEILMAIRKLGVSIAIDDFGTGYSSFSCLKSYPFNVIKIDASFVKRLPSHETDCVIVKTMSNVAKTMNLGLVVEGVETKEQLDFLCENDCREIQGFYFAKPMSANSFIKYLEKSKNGNCIS